MLHFLFVWPQSSEEAAAPGMRLWHKALSDVRSSAQLSLCIQQLQKTITWERSIMKVVSVSSNSYSKSLRACFNTDDTVSLKTGGSLKGHILVTDCNCIFLLNYMHIMKFSHGYINSLTSWCIWLSLFCLQHCQLCQKGDDEELLLLCDGCDNGCHTYCHKPRITTVPEGNWYCPACVEKVHQQVNSLLH